MSLAMRTRLSARTASAGPRSVRPTIAGGRAMTVRVLAAKEPTSQGEKTEVLTGDQINKTGSRGKSVYSEIKQGSNNEQEGMAPEGDKVLVGEQTQLAKPTKPVTEASSGPAAEEAHAGRQVDDSVRKHEAAVGLVNESKAEQTTGSVATKDRVPQPQGQTDKPL